MSNKLRLAELNWSGETFGQTRQHKIQYITELRILPETVPLNYCYYYFTLTWTTKTSKVNFLAKLELSELSCLFLFLFRSLFLNGNETNHWDWEQTTMAIAHIQMLPIRLRIYWLFRSSDWLWLWLRLWLELGLHSPSCFRAPTREETT